MHTESVKVMFTGIGKRKLAQVFNLYKYTYTYTYHLQLHWWELYSHNACATIPLDTSANGRAGVTH